MRWARYVDEDRAPVVAVLPVLTFGSRENGSCEEGKESRLYAARYRQREGVAGSMHTKRLARRGSTKEGVKEEGGGVGGIGVTLKTRVVML